jgi:uncharacterized protein (TIGR02145 family)
MKIFKKVQIYLLCIELVSVVFYGCKKDDIDNRVTASFTVDNAIGDSPLRVKFTNTSANALSYKWDFGDGTTLTTKDPIHSFTNISTTHAKSYKVTLSTFAIDHTSATNNKVITVNKSLQTGISTAVFNPDLSYGTMTDQDGNVYKTITIGTQIWMAENLRTTIYRNGDPIDNIIDSKAWIALSTGAWCTYGNTVNSDMIASYGILYNWYAVTDSRNIAPEGWHVPTNAEWTILTTYLGGESVAGGKMKEIGMAHWFSQNTGATNESGFTSLPGGDCSWYYNGTFLYQGSDGLYWSSTQVNASLAWSRELNNREFYCNYRNDSEKRNGYSVRLVKD